MGWTSLWRLRKFFFWIFWLDNTSLLFKFYPSHQSNYQSFDYLLIPTDVFSANQHAEISACMLTAFSVQVKVLRYNFSTVLHSKENIRKTWDFRWTNKVSEELTSPKKILVEKRREWQGPLKVLQANTFYCLRDIASNLLLYMTLQVNIFLAWHYLVLALRLATRQV